MVLDIQIVSHRKFPKKKHFSPSAYFPRIEGDVHFALSDFVCANAYQYM